MNVVRHDDEFVQEKSTYVAIVHEGFDQKIGRAPPPKDWKTLSGDSGDEEDALGVHLAILATKKGGSL